MRRGEESLDREGVNGGASEGGNFREEIKCRVGPENATPESKFKVSSY